MISDCTVFPHQEWFPLFSQHNRKTRRCHKHRVCVPMPSQNPGKPWRKNNRALNLVSPLTCQRPPSRLTYIYMSLPILHLCLPSGNHLWCEIWHLFNGFTRDDTAVFSNKQKSNTPGRRQRAQKREKQGIWRVCLYCYAVVVCFTDVSHGDQYHSDP